MKIRGVNKKVFTHRSPRLARGNKSLSILLSFLLASGFALLGNQSSSAEPTPQKEPRKILSGWIPYYGMSTSLPTAVANADLINEVMPFWYTLKLNKKNVPYVLDLYTPGNPSVAIDVPLTTMRNAGFKIIPTITDGMDKLVLAKLLAKSSDRAAVMKPIIDLVISKNYDGIDLDFEGFAFVDGTASWSTTKPNWVLFVKELSAALHAKGKLLSITAPVHFPLTEKQKGYTVYAWAEIATHIDRLRIMTYDYSTSRPGPIGPIAWVERTLKYAVSIMPASKVYIGLAGYGRDWVTKVEGTCPSNVAKVVTPSAKAATFIMRNAANLASTYGATPTYNTTFQEATFTYLKAYNGSTASGQATTCTATRTAWYQNSQSYTVRAELAAKYKIGGLVQWTMGMEDQAATDGIRRTALAIAPDEVLLNLSADQSVIKYGSLFKINFQSTKKDKTPVTNLPIFLEFKAYDESTWREIAKLSSGLSGIDVKDLYLAKSGKIRIRSEGNWERGAGLSPELSIVVNPKLSISAPTYGKANRALEVTALVIPYSSSAQVTLQRLDGKTWKNLTSAVNAIEGTKLTLTESARGIYTYRVVVINPADGSQSTSGEFSIIIR